MNQVKFSLRMSISVLVLGFLLFGLLSIYYGQDINWDLRNYHYYNPYAFLNGRLGYDYAPAQLQTYFNPLLDIPFYFVSAKLKPIVIGFLMGGLHGINLWFLFMVSYYILTLMQIKPKRRLSVSFICACIGVYGPAFWSEIGTTFNDNVTSLFVIIPLLIFLRETINCSTQHVRPSILLFMAVILGSGVGLKPSIMVYAIGFVLGFLAISVNWKQRFFNIALWAAGLSAGFLLTAGFWMIALLYKFRNSFFIFYNTILKSRPEYFPKNIIEKLFYPFYFATGKSTAMDLYFRDSRLAVIYVLFIVALFYVLYDRLKKNLNTFVEKDNKKNNIFRFVIVFFTSSYILWQITSSNYRHIVPLELISPILIIILLSRIIKNENKLISLTFVLFFLIFSIMRTPNWGRSPWTDSFFDIKIPKISNSSDSIVILANGEPRAYIIPFFPAHFRFISVNNNLFTPDLSNKLAKEIKEIISSHNGPFYLLALVNELNESRKMLEPYNLYISIHENIPIYDKIEEQLRLYRVYKK